MNEETYAIEAQVQRTHWWFVGRRRLLARLFRDLRPHATWRILEVGAGTGANLPVLDTLGVRQVVACDLSYEALQYSRAGARAAFVRSDACTLPFESHTFDVLLAADVIEHLDDDAAGLAEFVRVLKPGGHLILTVPAFPFLWGPQDIAAHHRRRYLQPRLLELIRSAGLRVGTCFHFNYLLLLPIWIVRKLLMAVGTRVNSENEINTDVVNRVLTRVFCADVDSAATLRPPIGVSLCVVADKPH